MPARTILLFGACLWAGILFAEVPEKAQKAFLNAQGFVQRTQYEEAIAELEGALKAAFAAHPRGVRDDRAGPRPAHRDGPATGARRGDRHQPCRPSGRRGGPAGSPGGSSRRRVAARPNGAGHRWGFRGDQRGDRGGFRKRTVSLLLDPMSSSGGSPPNPGCRMR